MLRPQQVNRMSEPFRRQIPRRRFLSLAAGATVGGAVVSALDFGGPTALAGILVAQGRPTRTTLPNGLVVTVDERRSADTVAVQLTARAGARDDAVQAGGVLLTSRMMFQGTSRRPSETDLQRAAAQVGGTLSRGTTVELSMFTSVVPSNEVDVAFDLLSDVILDPLFDADALGRQKEILFQEIGQRRANPSSVVDDLFNAAALAGHPASSPVLGTPESVALLTRDALLDARARLLGAANMALTIVGRIHPDDALARASRYFGAVPAGDPNRRPMMEPDLRDLPRTTRGQAGQQQVEFRLGFPTAGLLAPDRYPLTVFNALMTGTSGRLYRQLRSARGLAYVAGSAYAAFTDVGTWFATAGVDPENLDPALDVVRGEIERARSELPDATEVAESITQIAGRQILADERNSARASRLASQEVLGTEPTEEFVRRIRTVTPQDVLRVAQMYLDPTRAVLAVVSPPTPEAGSRRVGQEPQSTARSQ